MNYWCFFSYRTEQPSTGPPRPTGDGRVFRAAGLMGGTPMTHKRGYLFMGPARGGTSFLTPQRGVINLPNNWYQTPTPNFLGVPPPPKYRL